MRPLEWPASRELTDASYSRGDPMSRNVTDTRHSGDGTVSCGPTDRRHARDTSLAGERGDGGTVWREAGIYAM